MHKIRMHSKKVSIGITHSISVQSSSTQQQNSVSSRDVANIHVNSGVKSPWRRSAEV